MLVGQKKFDIFETIGILALLMPQFMEDHVKAQVSLGFDRFVKLCDSKSIAIMC